MTTEQEAYTITQHDVTNNTVTHRTIQPLPAPQRLSKPSLPSLSELKERAEDLITDLSESKEAYVNLSLDEYYKPEKEAEAEVLRLQGELGEAQSKLAELKRRGTPLSGYASHICSSEREVNSIANNLFHRLTEDAAKRTFRVSANRLSPDTRKDIELQFRDVLGRYVSPMYAHTHRRNNLTSEQLTGRADELIKDLHVLIEQALAK
jgi:hypothetical protein